MNRRRFLGSLGILTAGVGLAPVLAACGSGSTSSGVAQSTLKPRKGGTLRFGTSIISPYLNPLVTTDSQVQWVTDPVAESLYAYDDQLNSVPLLAAGEPVVSADGMTWTIALKQGIKFSNGDPLTADHVVAVLDFVSNPKAVSDWSTYFAYYVASSKAVNASTVQIKLSTPYGLLRSLLTNLPIIHKDYITKQGTTVGTGPFTVGAVTQGQSVTLNRNPGYHAAAPALDAVTYTSITDPATRLVSLREGKIDIMTDVPAEDAALLARYSGITVHAVEAPIDILTYFAANKPPFNNVKVRQALAYAMDRQGVREVVYSNQAMIGQGPVDPAQEGFDPSAQPYGGAPDIAKAKALLAEAGQPHPEFTLMISTSSNEMSSVAQVLMQAWTQAGFNVTLQSLSTDAWVANWAAGKYQLAMSIYNSGFGGGRVPFVTLGALSSANPLNLGYKNAQFDKLLGQAWATTSETERATLCQQLSAIAAADAIAVPPVYPKLIVAQGSGVSAIDQQQMQVGRIKVAPLELMG